jgi:3-demethoxyubiquinol 3-hydroxylase
VTGLCGRPSITATTVAVERVVLRHLQAQLRDLHETAPDACRAISSIMEDEQVHHDRAIAEKRQGIFWPRVLRPLVSASRARSVDKDRE